MGRRFTGAEKEHIQTLISEGFTNKEIAERLSRTEAAVRNNSYREYLVTETANQLRKLIRLAPTVTGNTFQSSVEAELMERYFEANRRRWNELVDIHTKSGGYDVNGFLKGKSSLHLIELEAIPDVEGKTLLHLQCHFGMDTLSWARRGAVVTGIDFSDKGVEMARLLAEKMGLTARWINCNLYDLPTHLDEKFDIVYTSYGVLMWLNDIEEWARIVARYLKPGGTFFIAEFHPLSWIFDFDHHSELVIKYGYWHNAEPDHYVSEDAYASGGMKLKNVDEYGWTHPIGTVVTALIDAGLTIQHLREYPYSVDEDQFKFMKKDEAGYWRLPGDPIPLMYSIKATKPLT